VKVQSPASAPKQSAEKHIDFSLYCHCCELFYRLDCLNSVLVLSIP
jgi:hypothetical protein